MSVKGRYLAIPWQRRMVTDLMDASRHVPLVPMERVMRLRPLEEARRSASPRPSWCAIFIRAYALATAPRPGFRQACLRWPWARLYEHPHSVASVIIEREANGVEFPIAGLVSEPESKTVAEIDARLKHLKTCGLWEDGSFRRCLRLSRLPWLLRRLAWWIGLEWLGRTRAKSFGTFGVSATAGQGAGQLSLISPATTTLHYGVMDETGRIPVRVTFDHRVLDGAPVARAMAEMESILLGQVMSEVRSMSGVAA